MLGNLESFHPASRQSQQDADRVRSNLLSDMAEDQILWQRRWSRFAGCNCRSSISTTRSRIRTKLLVLRQANMAFREGNVCALTAVELSPTFLHEKTKMEPRWRPQLAIYHYQIDPQFGWMHARTQTWFPFYVHVCINGREWLARRMDQAGIAYSRQQNCFPCCKTTAYYWTAFQCEWATDIGFLPGTLARLEPLLLRHGLLNFSSADLLRFMGKQIGLSGTVPDWVAGEVNSSLKSRVVGDRLKHWIQGNSPKCDGKAPTLAGDVLRVETMTGNVEIFRTCRPVEGGPEDELAWQRMRLRVADLHRRSEVSGNSSGRWSNRASTAVAASAPYVRSRQTTMLCLVSVNRGEFAINGFRNRDLQRLLYAGSGPDALPLAPRERRRRSAAISRKLRIRRAHGLIQKSTQNPPLSTHTKTICQMPHIGAPRQFRKHDDLRAARMGCKRIRRHPDILRGAT
jgi:hypothetical protein